jgi:hypothetical protein
MTTSTIVSLRLGVAVAAATLLLTGCGLAETTAVATAEAEASAQQIKEGKKLEEKVQHDIDAANQAAVDARAKAEEVTE